VLCDATRSNYDVPWNVTDFDGELFADGKSLSARIIIVFSRL